MKMMRVFKIVLSVLIIGSITLLSLSCMRGPNNATPTVAPQIAKVQIGNISNNVTGTGNLALARTQDLAFEMAGTVEQISVEESQSVKTGDELVTLDTSDWETQIKTLQKALDTANRALTSAQEDVTKAQALVATKEMAVKQAQLALDTAQYNLNQISELKNAQDHVDQAKAALDYGIAMKAAGDTTITNDYLYGTTGLQSQYDIAVKKLNALIKGTDTTITTSVALQISQNQFQVQQKQKDLDDAGTAVTDARTAVENAKLDKTDAETAVKDAQDNLTEVKNLSPVIKAPFDGFITKISVAGGDEIKKGTIAMQIADPNQFEANILVTETDIFSVKIGGEATVAVDALSGLSFPAKITAIAPLATVQQGVVNYKVTAEITSLKPVFPKLGSGQFTFGSGSMPTALPGGSPLPTAPPSGSPLPSKSPEGTGAPNPAGGGNQFGGGMGAMLNQNLTLKDGLSATVTIPIQQKDNVLIVPNRAITRQGGNTTVQVVKDNNTATPEVVSVKTGLSDGSNTEIVSGLNEGDQVLVKASSSGSQFRGGPMFFGP